MATLVSNELNVSNEPNVSNEVKDGQQTIEVTLAFAPTATQQYYKTLKIAAGSTILRALQQSGWLIKFPELMVWCENNQGIIDSKDINQRAWRIGVYSVKQPLSYVLIAHDRIEVYRPLMVEPQNRRKARAKSN